MWMSPRARAKWLKVLMAAVLAAVSLLFIYRSVAG
jgi:hypothetical protein